MQKQDYKTVREIADIEKYLCAAGVVSFDFETSATEKYRDEEWAALDAHKSEMRIQEPPRHYIAEGVLAYISCLHTLLAKANCIITTSKMLK